MENVCLLTMYQRRGIGNVRHPEIDPPRLGLSPNTQVGLSVSEGRLIVEPRPRQRYTLAELMEQCDLSAQATDEDRLGLRNPLAARSFDGSWRQLPCRPGSHQRPGTGRPRAPRWFPRENSTGLDTPLVCPITQGGNFARDRGFAVSLSGTAQRPGVVLCNQPRASTCKAAGQPS